MGDISDDKALLLDVGAAMAEIEPYVHDSLLMMGLSNILSRVRIALGGTPVANNPAVAGGRPPPWTQGVPTPHQQGLLQAAQSALQPPGGLRGTRPVTMNVDDLKPGPTLSQADIDQMRQAQQAYMAGTLAGGSNPAIEQMLKEKLAAQEKALQQAFSDALTTAPTSGKGLLAGTSLSGRSDAASRALGAQRDYEKQQRLAELEERARQKQQDLNDFYANTTPVSYGSIKRVPYIIQGEVKFDEVYNNDPKRLDYALRRGALDMLDYAYGHGCFGVTDVGLDAFSHQRVYRLKLEVLKP